jgi:rhodanese-related sulfurtransferase
MNAATPPADTAQPANLRRSISPVELWSALADDRAVLVDVREPVEFAGERIAGALSMPLSRFDTQALPTSSADRPVVFYCQSGNRSNQAAAQLIATGWGPVIDLEGGLNHWKAAGYPVQVDRRAPISLMRQVQIVAGSLVLLGTLLGAFVSPWFLVLSGFVGAGLMFAGITNTCGLAMLLAQLPYNRRYAER